jgi:hypothetical protein
LLTVAAFAMVTIVETAFITAAVMVSVDHVGLWTLALFLSVFGGMFWVGFSVSLISASASSLEKSIEDELTKGLLPKNKD